MQFILRADSYEYFNFFIRILKQSLIFLFLFGIYFLFFCVKHLKKSLILISHILKAYLVGTFAYQTNWYDYPLEQKKYFLFILAETQREHFITGYNMVTCSLSSYKEVHILRILFLMLCYIENIFLTVN